MDSGCRPSDFVREDLAQPFVTDLLLTYLKASSWFTPHRQGMTSCDEKPNLDKDAAKTKLSHSTEIRPPLVPLANLREAVVGARCKPSLPSSIIVQGCREPSPVLGLAPGIREE